ncbi:Mitochondrial glycoprotein [Lasallia pustulata]|uniref:Mitochondrial glycoprotein n=1 Tax=Lasallia pustulata TaxID=136370 RepID=A0A1W5D1J6_9LECA|nr:Mitochondrial glycoprotein [Lasallia pustulata]
MIAIRSFTRSIPRSLSRLSASSTRRPLSSLCQSPLLQQPWKAAPSFRYAAFSTSPKAYEKEGEMDQELSAKIDSELQMEKEMRDSDEIPETIRDYLEDGPFELHDTPGQEDVCLTRRYGNETIRITFSIADLNSLTDEDRFTEDPALQDEDSDSIPEEGQSGGAQSKGTINQGRSRGGNINVAPEDAVAPADRSELADDESAYNEDADADASFPARVHVTIEKAGHGALQVETVAQDGMIVIENVYYFPNAELADAKTADQDWTRRGLYTGPPFGNLDQDLQVMLERYLDERGVNTALALWVPEYIDFKEQREYLTWLANVKSFVDA